jgi:hypothetical protein
MYKSINEIIVEIEESPSTESQLALVRKYAQELPYVKPFLKWAVLNDKVPTFDKIPEYKQNMVGITFSYIKLENALKSLPYFFAGPNYMANKKRKMDKLFSILQEMSWLETSLYEDLVMNKFKHKVLTKEFVLEAFPSMELVA